MKKQITWSESAKHTINPIKHKMSNLAITVRSQQFEIMKNTLGFTSKSRVLDVGTTSDETLKDANQFVKLYPYQSKLTLATIEDVKKIKLRYPKAKVIEIEPGKPLPFKNKEFDIATSWATLEHVGGYIQQKFFLEELVRISQKTFVTTPYRGCIYEPHTSLPFIHWLPLSLFRFICSITDREFWSLESNLNPLWTNDIKKFNIRGLKIHVFKMFGLIPSHLLIVKNNSNQ